MKIMFAPILFFVNCLPPGMANFLLGSLLAACLTLGTVNCFAQPVTQQWVRKYPVTDSAQWNGLQIKSDNFGFIYVLGENRKDFGFLKYDVNGNLISLASYFPSGYQYGGGKRFDVTPAGDVYIVGEVSYDSYTYRVYTVKFNTNGVLQWVRPYDTSYAGHGNDIRVDNAGNIIVIGSDTYRGGLTLKYNANGDTLWTRGTGYASNNYVALDDTNNIYVDGSTNLGAGRCIILKFSSSGNLNWLRVFTIDSTRTNTPAGIALGGIGNSYVIGVQVIYGPGYDNYLLKVSNTGNFLWSAVYSGVDQGTASVKPVGPIVSLDGNSVYYASGTDDGQYGPAVILKYNTIGDSQWVRLFFPSQQPFTGANPGSIRLDTHGQVYICGSAIDSISGVDLFTIKYDFDGVEQWVSTYKSRALNNSDGANDIMIDTNLNVYVTGSGRRINTNYFDAVTIKYSQLVEIKRVASQIPATYELFQNFPNPFNPKTIITYEVPKLSDIKLVIYNILGETVKTVVNAKQQASTYIVAVNLSALASGVYFYRLFANGNVIDTKKLVLLK